MNCQICGKLFDGGLCPRCGNPVIYIPVESGEEGRRNQELLNREIASRRNRLIDEASLGLKIFYWKKQDSEFIVDRSELLPLGTGRELRGKTTWIHQEFARDPDGQTVTLNYTVTLGKETMDGEVNIQNIISTGLQQIGVEMDDKGSFKFLLRNDQGEMTTSKTLDLIC